ncbi:MAG: hypothetical protein QME35_05160 [Thermoanaerobacteraceae bacterium]|nr:hypothetical protein [Thermoanaerobacteraceae bacterium]
MSFKNERQKEFLRQIREYEEENILSQIELCKEIVNNYINYKKQKVLVIFKKYMTLLINLIKVI